MLAACTLIVDLRIPDSHSLKAKRSAVEHPLEACRSRFGVAAAEVGFPDKRQRTELGSAAVSGTVGQVESVLDSVEHFVWSHPEVEVVARSRAWFASDR